MIPKREILELATQSNLQPHVVEKDYVLGWLLAGIHQEPRISEAWIFKGGTCLKKCYFDTYRFSEDLDFTVNDASHINEGFLHDTFTDIAAWVYDNSGIEIPADRLLFDVYKNPPGVDACQGRVYYRGPVSPGGKHSTPRIKLDLSPDEIVIEPPVVRPVSHEYSDFQTTNFEIRSYSYAEVFSEKIRALKERTRPRDLFDVINLFRRPESYTIAAQVSSVLTQKCRRKSIDFPRSGDLDDHKDECASGWQDQLGHQLPALPPFESFWNELPAFFGWLDQVPAPVLAGIPFQMGETNALTAGADTPQTSKLDRVRYAAVNRLCVELDYRKESGQRQTYLIEPYSLRATAEDKLILYAVKLPTAEIRSFRVDRIIDAKATERAFAPRYSVDFIPEDSVSRSIHRSGAQSLDIPERQSRVTRLRRLAKITYPISGVSSYS